MHVEKQVFNLKKINSYHNATVIINAKITIVKEIITDLKLAQGFLW